MSRPAIAAWYEVPDQRLLAQRQIAEAVGVELHDGGFVDALEQVRAVGQAQRWHVDGASVVGAHPIP